MLKGVNAGSPWIEVMGGSVSGMPYVSNSTTNPIEGMIRISGSEIQVYANGVWMNISSGYATVGMTPQADSVLRWASDKMREEQERERKAKDNPALQNALAAIKRAEANFDLLDKIANSTEIQMN
jgi:hypothetical protein